MGGSDDEDQLLRSVALQNAQSIFLARQRAEEDLLRAKEALERRTEELVQQREWFKVTLSSIGDAVITTDTEGKVTFLNPVAEGLTGWKSSEAAGRPLERVFNIINEKNRQAAANPISKVLREGIAVGLANHTALIAKDGRETSIEDSAAPIKDASGKISGAVMVFHDVTERRRAEEALRRSEQTLADFFNNAAVGLHWVGPDGKVLRANRTELELLGYSEEEYIGHHIAEFHADAPVIEDILGKLGGGETLHNYEARLRCKDGSFKHVLISSNVLWEDEKFIHTRCFTRDITQQTLARQALRDSENRKSAILNAALDAIITMDHEGKISDFNPAAERIFGYRRDNVVGKPLAELIIPERLREQHYAGLARYLASGEGRVLGKRIELPALHADGHEFPAEVSINRISGIEPPIFTATLRDISEAKQAQTLQARLAAIVECSDDAIIGMALNAIIISWNKGAERIFGYRAEEMIGEPITKIIPADRSDEEDFILGRLRQSERVEHYETVRKAKDGRLINVSLTSSLIRDAQGEVIGASKIIRDITERKQAEENRRRSEDELRALADSIPQLAWIAKPDGHIFWYNRGWYDYTGTTLEQMQGWGWQSVHDPEILPAVLERWGECIRTGRPFEMEFPLRGVDGVFRWFLTRVNPVLNAEGSVARWFGTNTNVDEVRRAQKALEDKSRILELLNKAGTTLASNLNLQALVQSVTDAATQLSGANFGAFFYNTTDEKGDAYLLYTLSGAAREAFEKVRAPRTPLFSPTFQGDSPIRCNDVLADPRYAKLAPHHGMPEAQLPVRSYLAVPVVSRSGEVIGGLFFGHSEPGIFSERTERILVGIAAQAAVAIDNARLYEAAKKAAEEREKLLASERSARAEAEKMSEMKEEFLATLSHELRTPLSAILGWAHLLRRGALGEADLRTGLDTIERNARVQTQLIEDLLDMSRITSGKVRLDIQPVAPVSFIEAAVETVRPAAVAKGIRLEKLLDPLAGPISGDPGRLQQVIWNLLSNAIKFTPKEGKVQVLLERVNSHIEISVADTGIGIKPEFMPHVFERFRQADSSTTRRYGGLGLGLSIVKNLVELHGGKIWVKSAGEDRGATFTVYLPVTVVHRNTDDRDERSHPRTQSASVDFKAPDLSGVKVLVVDDESEARDLIERVLASCAAEVITAGNAAAALLLIEKERPDVLLSDIGMPDVDGFELIRRVRALGRARGGRIPAIALTAFARSEDRTRALRAGFQVHISKPVEPSELVAAVASVAGRTGEETVSEND